MTGIKDWNFPAFFAAELFLKSLGHEVVNPARNNGDTLEAAIADAGTAESPSRSWEYYIRRDVPRVFECDAVCVLPGWRKSRGALLEIANASAIGIPVMIIKDGALVPRVQAVGLSGWARSGKDTAAKYFIEELGHIRVSFADPIREALSRLNPYVDCGVEFRATPLSWVVNKVGWEDAKEFCPDVRRLLQRFGTEVARELWDEDFWVNAAIRSAPDGSKIVFSDVRYPNEADAVKKLGGYVIRIERPEVGPANKHTSETALNDYDFDEVVVNDGTIKELNDKIKEVVERRKLEV
jgi:hypothetical protein